VSFATHPSPSRLPQVLKRDRPVFTVEVEATKEAATEALILR
jgi:hypothetical protein